MQFKNPIIISTILLAAFIISIFYIYKFLIQPAGAIYLKDEITEASDTNNFHIVTVFAEDLKVPFFGVAFHVNYIPQNYSYDHFTLGDYFEPQDDPMVLVNPVITENNANNAKIVIGISLKRSQLITKPEGTLLKLYFKNVSQKKIFQNFSADQSQSNQPKDFSFSNAIFSSFDIKKSERIDIQNITFYP